MLTMLLLLLSLALLAPAQDAPAAVVFRGVTVIDVRNGERTAERTVVVSGERIVAAGDGSLDAPEGIVVEAQGLFMIPGLWDMHVHATSSLRFPELFVANGVTGVRDMFTMGDVKAVESRYVNGSALGPRVVGAGRILDGEQPFWPGSLEAKDADQGRAAVSELRADGASFIKVYSKLAPDTYRAIAAEAREQGIPFAGHVPSAVRAMEAARLGQKSIEHLSGVLAGCSTEEQRILSGELGYQERARLALETFDEERAATLFAAFAEHSTWHCPTLTVLRSIAHLDDADFVADERIRHLPSFWKDIWNPSNDWRFQSYTEQDWDSARAGWRKSLEVVGALHAAGVPLLAGTDCANPYCFPGFSLHDELGLFVEAGLTPLEALRTATWNPAVFLGLQDDLGAVEAGRLADLVLLARDPLEDIANTRSIVGVVANGRWIDADRVRALIGE